ncbi:Multidrug efflux pump subunit AcrA [Sporomusa acidovorans DSM 3132]|uniref:Multidrug efflux pump subunit AcrA n=1 Tax=Sporomusa acidovorans (strain ATCC 49682 / DSM 3132 / Mol) TaxID=1123286 RepID=A0ABZ3IYC4_SPOA4|nr:efflux RND transporter periplasmic adaptor subunit [Sporomusa acidovorans]OZC17163.1 multidrug efflux pump subunit AcrA precursor [Sporomusa acidovorans DSM 3132]SDE81088.1 membrane fusion protein, multidrug efflux system [Sporomusa acidovorans]
MSSRGSKKLYIGLFLIVIALGVVVARSGILSKTQPAMAQAVAVKAMQVITRDTPVNSEFVGQVRAKSEIKVMSKISGNIVEKMVNGGDNVYKGQPLFRIDNKQYRSAVNSARATLNKSQATLNNTRMDVARYQKLAAVDGIARQTLDSYIAKAEEEEAEVEANQANLQQAMEAEQDTLIISPVDGRIDVNDVSLGYYVVAGSTTMATVSSIDPIWVQFSMSENEYLTFIRSGNGTLPESFKDHLKLVLSDGKEYSLIGHVEQIDKGINDTTGTITIKASFDNPQRFLLPGMFARVVVQETVRPGALLIPQKAVKQVLDNTFVFVVTDDNKAESRQVKLGERIGDMWLVEDGLSTTDRIVVEGIDKVKQGNDLQVTMVQPDEQTPARQ